MIRTRLAAVIGMCLLLIAQAAFAHRIDEYLQATVLSLTGNEVDASMRLVPGVLVSAPVIAAIDTNGDGAFSAAEEHAYAQQVLDDLSIMIDGQHARPRLVSWDFPDPEQMREGTGEIGIRYTVDLPRGRTNRTFVLANHHMPARSVYLMNALVPDDHNLQIVGQKRNQVQSIYELDFSQTGAGFARLRGADLRTWLEGIQFSSLFQLGMHHIAEGTDHLLFLLTLLLPAPLIAFGGRWRKAASTGHSLRRILGIVTAFTIGHSVTLTLAALGLVRVPDRPVEALIAVSIFVSAMHALRPILPGKEALIAGFFGLIHGLAFAATLSRLGLERWDRVAGILAFNLGIEAMQMIVVAAVLPSLILMSRTRAYGPFRVLGALVAGAASVAWMTERIFGLETPVDAVINGIARHCVWIAATLFLAAVASRQLIPALRECPEIPASDAA